MRKRYRSIFLMGKHNKNIAVFRQYSHDHGGKAPLQEEYSSFCLSCPVPPPPSLSLSLSRSLAIFSPFPSSCLSVCRSLSLCLSLSLPLSLLSDCLYLSLSLCVCPSASLSHPLVRKLLMFI